MAPMDPSFAAQTLTLEPSASGGTIEIVYTVNARPPALLRVRYPDEIDEVPAPALDLVVAAAAIYLGSLALAKDVRIERPLSSRLLEDLSRIVEMLYDIRRWKDE